MCMCMRVCVAGRRYLIKLGGVSLGLRALKRWTRRYFELKGPILRYWETKADKENGGLSSVRGAYELDGTCVKCWSGCTCFSLVVGACFVVLLS